jgi:hypothetical protein
MHDDDRGEEDEAYVYEVRSFPTVTVFVNSVAAEFLPYLVSSLETVM